MTNATTTTRAALVGGALVTVTVAKRCFACQKRAVVVTPAGPACRTHQAVVAK